jgi:hypothetical protein
MGNMNESLSTNDISLNLSKAIPAQRLEVILSLIHNPKLPQEHRPMQSELKLSAFRSMPMGK